MSQAQYLDGYDDGFAVGVRLAKSKGWGGQASVSNMKVELISECSTGYVRLKCGSLAGTPLEIDLSKVASYSSVQYYINGSETPVTTFPSDLVPTSGTTISIRAVVTSAPAT